VLVSGGALDAAACCRPAAMSAPRKFSGQRPVERVLMPGEEVGFGKGQATINGHDEVRRPGCDRQSSKSVRARSRRRPAQHPRLHPTARTRDRCRARVCPTQPTRPNRSTQAASDGALPDDRRLRGAATMSASLRTGCCRRKPGEQDRHHRINKQLRESVVPARVGAVTMRKSMPSSCRPDSLSVRANSRWRHYERRASEQMPL